jgi:hypothetical protein
LGDVARQSSRQKSNAAPSKVITNDDISSGSGLGVIGSKRPGGGSAASSADTSPSQDLDKVEAAVVKLDKLDRASLVKAVLQADNVDFPGRAAWEARLVAAKQDYVEQLRDLTREARQLDASAKSLEAARAAQGALSENDPGLLQLKAKIKDLVQNAVHIDAAFQAVVMEGRNRALEASSH